MSGIVYSGHTKPDYLEIGTELEAYRLSSIIRLSLQKSKTCILIQPVKRQIPSVRYIPTFVLQIDLYLSPLFHFFPIKNDCQVSISVPLQILHRNVENICDRTFVTI